MIAEAVITGWHWLIVAGIFLCAFLGGSGSRALNLTVHLGWPMKEALSPPASGSGPE